MIKKKFELNSQKGWRTNGSIAWLECTTRRIVHNSRALAISTGAKCFGSLFIGHTIHSLHICFTHRQWPGAMGFYFVRINACKSCIKIQSINQHFFFLPLYLFHSAKSLRTPSNVFVVNLAFCDFVMMTKTPIFIYNSFNHGYALGSTGCQIFALMGSLSGIGAAMTNACIAYDRLLNSK